MSNAENLLNFYRSYDIYKFKKYREETKMLFKNDYRFSEDLRLVRELRGLTQVEMADRIGVGVATIRRWERDEVYPDADNVEAFYAFAYREGVELNRIKEQFYREEISQKEILLFHGAKSFIEGDTVLTDVSRENNDFGTGFYTGETFRQAALFVSQFQDSCVYMMAFDSEGLTPAVYQVDREWLLAISCFRGRMQGRIPTLLAEQIRQKANSADYIVAPIADNRMFQIIDNFIAGEITDEQCIHALAATHLGMQYVIKSRKAAKRIRLLERCYTCTNENAKYIAARNEEFRQSEDKVRAARIKYRGNGRYIDELFGEEGLYEKN